MKARLVNENQENQNIFSDEDYNFIYKKLEYTFKKNGYPIIDKILNKEKLTMKNLHFF